MILNISGRCDILAFFSEWLVNRFKYGYVDVRNPYYPKQISRIILNPNNIELIVFCTKNPIPLLSILTTFDDYHCLFNVSITPYHKDIEPNVPDKKAVIEAVQVLALKYGKHSVMVRYDPILLSDTYSVDYHYRAFESLCKQLVGYIETIIISFVDLKKNTIRNLNKMQAHELSEEEMLEIAAGLVKIANRYHLFLQTCAEKINLEGLGFINEPCLSANTYFKLTGNVPKIGKGHQRVACQCLKSSDIGVYNSCPHFCLYCYANYDEEKVLSNLSIHNPNSSLLIGELQSEDIIKVK